MTDCEQTVETACAVCMNVLPAGANRVYTACGHLFCVSCILKWHKVNQTSATCPLCRQRLYEDEDEDENEAHDFEGEHDRGGVSVATELATGELFSQVERDMHERMLALVTSSSDRVCIDDASLEYKGVIDIYTVSTDDVIDVGTSNPNSYYIVELAASPHRYKFGQIESSMGALGFVFREATFRPNATSESGNELMVWSDRAELIPVADITSLNQYFPKIIVHV